MEISFEDAQMVFDALVSSMDFGSGFLDTDTVNALRRMAVALKVSPDEATPAEFKAQYPHAYVDKSWNLDDYRGIKEYSHGKRIYETDADVIARMGPPPQRCQAGPYSRKCDKPRDHALHQNLSDLPGREAS